MKERSRANLCKRHTRDILVVSSVGRHTGGKQVQGEGSKRMGEVHKDDPISRGDDGARRGSDQVLGSIDNASPVWGGARNAVHLLHHVHWFVARWNCPYSAATAQTPSILAIRTELLQYVQDGCQLVARDILHGTTTQHLGRLNRMGCLSTTSQLTIKERGIVVDHSNTSLQEKSNAQSLQHSLRHCSLLRVVQHPRVLHQYASWSS